MFSGTYSPNFLISGPTLTVNINSTYRDILWWDKTSYGLDPNNLFSVRLANNLVLVAKYESLELRRFDSEGGEFPEELVDEIAVNPQIDEASLSYPYLFLRFDESIQTVDLKATEENQQIACDFRVLKSYFKGFENVVAHRNGVVTWDVYESEFRIVIFGEYPQTTFMGGPFSFKDMINSFWFNEPDLKTDRKRSKTFRPKAGHKKKANGTLTLRNMKVFKKGVFIIGIVGEDCYFLSMVEIVSQKEATVEDFHKIDFPEEYAGKEENSDRPGTAWPAHKYWRDGQYTLKDRSVFFEMKYLKHPCCIIFSPVVCRYSLYVYRKNMIQPIFFWKQHNFTNNQASVLAQWDPNENKICLGYIDKQKVGTKKVSGKTKKVMKRTFKIVRLKIM